MKPLFCTIIWILIVHWVADFILQDDKMAINKSKSMKHLSLHCLVYTMYMFSAIITSTMFFKSEDFSNFSWLASLAIFCLIFISHFMVDGVTSRISSSLYYQQKRHLFFVVIGFDQVLHYIVIIWMFYILKIVNMI